MDDQIFVYDLDGVYRLNPDTLTAELLYALPRAFSTLGHAVALPDGGLLVAHLDLSDKRLIALNADGTLRWERSISRIVLGLPRLFVIDDNVYGVLRDGDVVSIDAASGEVRRIFDVGTRDPLPGETWAFASGADRILIDYRGGSIVAFDPQIALDAMLSGSDSQ